MRVWLGLVIASSALVSCRCDRPKAPCTVDSECPSTYSCVSSKCEKCPVCGANERCEAGACVSDNQNRLVFVSTPVVLAASQCSSTLTVEAQDPSGLAAPPAADVTLSLTASTSTATFYSDDLCMTAATELNVAAGAAAATFHFKDTAAGSPRITVAAPSYDPAIQTETVTENTSGKLAFTNTMKTVTAGTCSTALQLEVQDNGGTPITVPTSTMVSLTGLPSGLTFFSDSLCNTAAPMLTIGAGAGTTTFYVRGNTAGSITVTASANGYTPASQAVQVDPRPPTVLFITSAAQTVAAGECSGNPVVLVTRDNLGNASNVMTALTVNLSGPTTAMTFYSDSGCTMQASMRMVAAGTNTINLWFKDTVTGTRQLTAAATAYTSANQPQTITAGPPVRLGFGTAVTVLASVCSAAITLQTRDMLSNPTLAPADVMVDLALTSAPGAVATAAALYSDSSCSTLVTQVTIPTGTSQRLLYLKGLTGGTVTVNATSAQIATGGTQNESITPTVRGGTCTLGAGASSTSCAVGSPALGATTRTMLVFQATTSTPDGTDANVRCVLASTSLISCDRAGTAGQANIQWYTAEFPPNTVTVRHATATCGGASTPVGFSPVVSSMNDSFVLFSSTRAGQSGQTAAATRTAKLSSTSQVTVDHNTGPCSNDAFGVQVVEVPGANVTRGTTSISGASATVMSLAVVDTARTFLLHTSRSSGSTACSRMVRGAIASTTSLTFTHGCTAASVDELHWERVELPAGNVVDSVPVNLAAGAASGTTALSAAVDTTRTLPFSAGQLTGGQAIGEMGLASGEVFGEALGRHALTNSTTMQVTRDSTGGTAAFTTFAVQLRP